MASLSTFAELMARASATVFTQLCNNALEKAAQQQQQQNGVIFPPLGPLLTIPPHPLPSSISPIIPEQKLSTQKLNSEDNQPKGNNNNKTNSQQQERGKKRKKPAVEQAAEEAEKRGQQKNAFKANGNSGNESTSQQQSLLAAPIMDHRQPSSSPLSGSRISSPDSISAHKARKLKLYAAEEKTDIIDYAKCIGNRAAGREFNVAESSIREWRKNEEKIRRQAESTIGCTQHFELKRPDIIAEIDNALVQMLNSRDKRCPTWYGIAEQANVLWREIVKKDGSKLEGGEMKITMGWVSRFMRRNESLVPKISPPIIATGANSSTAGNGSATNSSSCLSTTSPSMVRRCTILDSLAPELRTKGGKNKSKALENGKAGEKKQKMMESMKASLENGKEEKMKTTSSRRKQFRPMRVDATLATLLTTTTSSIPLKIEVKNELEM